MKRRTFIRLVGASALGLPFMSSYFGAGARRKSAVPAPERLPLTLKLAPDESEIIGVLRRHSSGVYLVGGGVLAKASGVDLPYLNLVAAGRKFARVKQALFEHGVSPISTPTLPSSYIRFTQGERAYSVVNLSLDTYLQQNVLGPQPNLLPLAHNFLVSDPADKWVMDPYGALAEKVGKGFRSKMVREPASPAMGLELCLAALFDSALLGLALPPGFAALEDRVLSASAETEQEATFLFYQVLNYFPDVIELHGWETARKYLAAPLFVTAAIRGPRIDLTRVEASLRAAAARGKDITGSMLISRLNEEFKRADQAPVFGIGLPDYLAAKRIPVRRGDVFAEALSAPSPEVA